MYPILFAFGPITVYSYGFFLALAYLAATYILWKEGKKQGFQEEKLIDLSIASLLAAVIGGRLFYVLLNFQAFQQSWQSIFYFWEGGFAYYGSVLGVGLVSIFLLRHWHWSILSLADIGAIAVLAATVFAKIGSFLAGNDFGAVTSLPWGVTFTYLEGSRHPVQLYEAAFALILFTVLYRAYRNKLKNATSYRAGEIFLYFIFWSNLGRTFFELFRGDSTFVGPFRLASIISLTLAGLSLFSLYFYQFRDLDNDRHHLGRYIFGLGHLRPRFKRGRDEYRKF